MHDMPAHMAKTERRSRGAFLLIALGIGVAVFALIDANPGSDEALDTGIIRPSASSPTVLGATVTTPPVVPTAGAATPATFGVPSSVAAPDRTRPPIRGGLGTSTTLPSPVIGPPTSIYNSTTTTATGGTTSSTTTAPATTTTEATTTTAEEPTTTTDTSVP